MIDLKNMSKNNYNIFCVIPAYNEEKNISKVIDKVKKYIKKIVIIDDGSKDNTFFEAKKHKLIILKHIINRGQGAALQTGNEYALKKGADVIIHFDADGQFLAREIKDITKPILNNEADIVFGSRFLEKKSNMPGFKKFFIMPVAKLINKVFFKINLSDPQSGFRALSRQAAKKIKIENDGSAHCNEIMHKAFKNNFRIREVPITVKYNNFGQTLFGGKGRGKGGVKIIKDLILSKIIN